jgi:hypothetical protein
MPDLQKHPAWIARLQAERVRRQLEQFPAVALLGPRQVGKTTLALQLAESIPSLYLDLEAPADRTSLAEAPAGAIRGVAGGDRCRTPGRTSFRALPAAWLRFGGADPPKQRIAGGPHRLPGASRPQPAGARPRRPGPPLDRRRLSRQRPVCNIALRRLATCCLCDPAAWSMGDVPKNSKRLRRYWQAGWLRENDHQQPTAKCKDLESLRVKN